MIRMGKSIRHKWVNRSPEPQSHQVSRIPMLPRHSAVLSIRQQCSNIFFSKKAWPVKPTFHVEPPSEGETKVYINGQGHLIKMAAKPINWKSNDLETT